MRSARGRDLHEAFLALPHIATRGEGRPSAKLVLGLDSVLMPENLKSRIIRDIIQQLKR